VAILLTRSDADPTLRRAERILGIRDLLQAIVIGRRRSSRWLLAGAAIDVIHAVTMVGVATSGSRYRRPAAISTVMAAAFTAAAVPEIRRRELTVAARHGRPW
jgi:hypothetical protein